MAASDPSYPLYPIASTLAAVLLLLVLLSSFIRKSWNLGVSSLCFWLCIENLTSGVDAIVWFDNADIKFYVYCDIGTCRGILGGGSVNPYISVASSASDSSREAYGDLDHNSSTVSDRQPKIGGLA